MNMGARTGMSELGDVLLSVQRALLGAVPRSLRAVTCALHPDRIVLKFIFHGPISDTDKEDMQVVGTEVVADFHAPMKIEEQIVRIDYPGDMRPHGLQAWAYWRKE
jgi:hypothetical protein